MTVPVAAPGPPGWTREVDDVTHCFENKDELILAAANAVSDYLHQAFPATSRPFRVPIPFGSKCWSACRSTTTSSRAIG
jgi:hypothetical protein